MSGVWRLPGLVGQDTWGRLQAVLQDTVWKAHGNSNVRGCSCRGWEGSQQMGASRGEGGRPRPRALGSQAHRSHRVPCGDGIDAERRVTGSPVDM